MSSFSADALVTDPSGMAFLADTIDADPRSDDAFAKAFDPAGRPGARTALAARQTDSEAGLLLQPEHA